MSESRVQPPSMDFEIDVDRDVNRVTLRGAFDFESLVPRFVGIRDHPDYRAGRHYLLDAGEATFASMTSAQMDSLGAFIEAEWKLPLGTRVALVVRQDVDFGLGRMFSMMNDEKLPFAYQVFRERSEAESWISSE